MSAGTPISLERYFANPTKPASEYVDGELIQKAMPTNLHADLQFWIAQLLFELFGRPRLRIRTEQNLRLSENMILIPDACAAGAELIPRGGILNAGYVSLALADIFQQ